MTHMGLSPNLGGKDPEVGREEERGSRTQRCSLFAG